MALGFLFILSPWSKIFKFEFCGKKYVLSLSNVSVKFSSLKFNIAEILVYPKILREFSRHFIEFSRHFIVTSNSPPSWRLSNSEVGNTSHHSYFLLDRHSILRSSYSSHFQVLVNLSFEMTVFLKSFSNCNQPKYSHPENVLPVFY